MNISCIRFLKALAVCVSACLVALVKVSAQAPTIIYSDLLLNGFQDWSWGTRDFANPSPVHNGSESISASLGDWEAISFYHSDLNANVYSNLSFWANGGTDALTDLLILRRRPDATEPFSESWVSTRTVGASGGEARINQHFIEHP